MRLFKSNVEFGFRSLFLRAYPELDISQLLPEEQGLTGQSA